MVQWFRIHFQMQGTWVPSLVRKLRSHMMRTAKSMCHNEKPEYHNKEPVQPKNNSKKGIEQELEGFDF